MRSILLLLSSVLAAVTAVAADGYWIGSYESTRNQNWTYANNWKDGVIAGRYKVGGEIVGDYGSTAYFGSESADWFMIPQFNTSPLESVYRLVVDGNNFPQLGNSNFHLIPIEEGGGIYVTSQCTKDVKVLAKPCVYQNTFAATNYFINESSGHTLQLDCGLANAVSSAAKFCYPVFRFGGCGNISFGSSTYGGGMPACNNFRNYIQLAFTDGGVFTLAGTATFGNMMQIYTVKDCGPQTIRITGNAVCAPGLGNEAGSGLVANTDLNVISNGTLKLMAANGSAAALTVKEGCTMTIETTLKSSVDGVPLRVQGSGDGDGGVLRVTGPNLFTGNVQIKDGATFETSRIGSAGEESPLGSGAAVILSGGGTLMHTGSEVETADRPLTLSKGLGSLGSSGAGKLTYTGTVTPQAAGTRLGLAGDSATPAVFAGTVDNSAYSVGLEKHGAGEWVLSSWPDNIGDRYVTGGTLTIPSGGRLVSGASQQLEIGGKTGDAVLNVQEGAVVTGSLAVAYGGTDVAGAVYQSGGLVYRTTGGRGQFIGGGIGYYRISGGTFETAADQGIIGNGGQGVFEQLGGEVKLNGYPILGRSGGAGVVRQSGGTLTCGRVYLTNSGGQPWSSYYTIDGATAKTDLGSDVFYMASGTRTGSRGPLKAILNLNGGVMRCNGIGRYPSYLSDDSRAYVNFNGGTYEPSGYTTPFGGGAGSYPTHPHRVTVFKGGAAFDASFGNYSLSMPLLAPTGNSVATVPVPAELADRKFSVSPYIEILDTEGSGDGASAFAEIDIATRRISRIVVTSPGWDYTAAKAVFVMGDKVLCTNDCTLAAAESGGLTKLGANALTLNQTNTYTGATVVKAGTLVLAADDVISAASELVLDGGDLNLKNHRATFSSLDVRSGAVTNGKIGLSGLTADFAEAKVSGPKTVDFSYVEGFSAGAKLTLKNFDPEELDPADRGYWLFRFRNATAPIALDTSDIVLPQGWHLSVTASGVRIAKDMGILLLVR